MAQKVTEDPGESSSPPFVRNTRVVGYLLAAFLLAIITTEYVRLVIGSLVTSSNSKSVPCDANLSVVLGNYTSFPNGSIVDDTGEEYPEGFHFTTGQTTRGCICALRPCIRKCCARDEWLEQDTQKRLGCAYTSEEVRFEDFSLTIYKTPSITANMSLDDFKVLHGDVCLRGKFWMNPSSNPDDRNYLLTDGRILVYGFYQEEVYFDASNYCLDRINGSEEVYTFLCVQPIEDDTEERKFQFAYYPVGMILSLPFLFVTFAVYALLPDLHDNLHGQTLMCYVLSLLLSCVFLTIVQLKGDKLSDGWCVSIGKSVGVV